MCQLEHNSYFPLSNQTWVALHQQGRTQQNSLSEADCHPNTRLTLRPIPENVQLSSKYKFYSIQSTCGKQQQTLNDHSTQNSLCGNVDITCIRCQDLSDVNKNVLMY